MAQLRQVLTIEDDSAIRRGIVDALEFAGYAVIEAMANGCLPVLSDLPSPRHRRRAARRVWRRGSG